MTRSALPIADDVAAAAAHGQWCPKLCSHTCPVLRATARPDAVPWSFHRTVADLGDGRLAPEDAAGRLVACTGCRACAGGCEIDGQDVPAQVLAGRAAVHAVGAALPAVADAAAAVAAGASPYDVTRAPAIRAAHPDVVLVVGCRDEQSTIAAAVRLLVAAGQVADLVVPAGCCGAVLDDLGATEAATAARDATTAALDAATSTRTDPDGGHLPVVLLDPHCRSSMPGRTGVVDLVAHLLDLVDEGALTFSRPPAAVRWHEPCVLRSTVAAGTGPALLAAAGALVELHGEPHHGCSGAGLGLPLLDDAASRTVAEHRVAALAGPGPLVTACSGAATSLGRVDDTSSHVVTLLASLLDDPPESVA